MPAKVEEELQEFERDLAHLMARFMRLYDHVERTARPVRTPPTVPPPRSVEPPGHLPGYQ